MSYPGNLEPPNCRAGRDGDCYWAHCPQLRDGEPESTGRSCPFPHFTDHPEPIKPIKAL